MLTLVTAIMGTTLRYPNALLMIKRMHLQYSIFPSMSYRVSLHINSSRRASTGFTTSCQPLAEYERQRPPDRRKSRPRRLQQHNHNNPPDIGPVPQDVPFRRYMGSVGRFCGPLSILVRSAAAFAKSPFSPSTPSISVFEIDPIVDPIFLILTFHL